MASIKERFLAMERRERIMVSVLGVVLLLALVYALFSGGGGGNVEVLHTPTGTLPPVVVSPTGTTSPAPIMTGVTGGKDPFQPLVVESTAGPGPGPSGSPTPGPSGGPTTAPGGESNRVVLRDIFRSKGHLVATVEVNGHTYTVEPGDTFANDFQLISLTTRCGEFAFGDERFSLCVGQEVRK